MNIIPVKYKGEVIGHTDNCGYVIVENQELWDKLVLNNSKNIFISSRSKGTIGLDGRIIEEETISYDIESLTPEDEWSKKLEDREWNRSFEKGSIVMFDETWMNDVEKKVYKDLLGRTGKVLECSSDLHAFGRGSLYHHKIQWPGGKITGVHDGTYDKINFTPNGLGPSATILEDFHVKYLKDLQEAFPNNKVEFGRGERIIIDGKIVPGLLCDAPRTPYDENLKSVVDLIKLMMKI